MGMSDESDLLARVRAELARLQGDLPRVARESGVPYDSLLRVKNAEGDVMYSRVKQLADYLFRVAA